MKFSIVHRTFYRYTAPVYYSIQQLHLTPRIEAHQRTLRWKIEAPGSLTSGVDAYGNTMHTLALAEAHGDVEIEARGEVEVDALVDGLLDEADVGVPSLAFIEPTPLTAADAALREFAATRLRNLDTHGLLQFAHEVADAVAYQTGTTEVTSTASEALAQARGVCQDQAHVFIAACRARGLPARYVSGYLYPGDTPHTASHAWADVFLVDRGWTSYDITNRGFASDQVCRLAVGRDYTSAAPVRGVRVGGGDESMEVRVNIEPFFFQRDAKPGDAGMVRDV